MADAAAELEHGGIVRTLKDLFAGAAGGVAQVLLGMGFPLPFLRTADIENGASYLVTCLRRFLSIAPKALDFLFILLACYQKSAIHRFWRCLKEWRLLEECRDKENRTQISTFLMRSRSTI
jgi:hypothetical protein